jgi:hypothetical protein
MEKLLTHCFEVYRQDLPPHEGLLRTICTEALTLDEALVNVKKIVDEKYEFKTFIIKK